MRAQVAVLAAVLLAGCGGAEQRATERPRAHLRAADRICADAQDAIDRSIEGILAAGRAYERSGSEDDFAAVGRAWSDIWYALDRTSKELRAAVEPNVDADYDRFADAWKRMAAQADRVVDVTDNADPQVVTRALGTLKERTAQVEQAARTAGVERCQAPLSRVRGTEA